jgi:hypothetical protein
MDNKLIFVLARKHTIAFNSDSVIHRGHDGGSYRLMSPIFDQEPKKTSEDGIDKAECSHCVLTGKRRTKLWLHLIRHSGGRADETAGTRVI